MPGTLVKKTTYYPANIDTKSPFIKAISEFVVLHKFNQPWITSYHGHDSQIDHVQTYKSRIMLITNSDKLYYISFCNILKELATQWFHTLKWGLIRTFSQLSDQFISQFIGMYEQPKLDIELLILKKKKPELLKDFVGRFNKEKLKVNVLLGSL